MQAIYEALRSTYYGKFNLPPFETVSAAFYDGNERVLSDWGRWIESCTRWPASTFFWTTDDPPFFVSVGNPYGTTDPWIWFPEDRLEIWFRQGAPPLRAYAEQLLQRVQEVAVKTAVPFLEIDSVDTTGGVHSRQFQQGKWLEETV